MPLVDRFLFREARVEAVAAAGGQRPVNPSPFQPFKSPTTGRWMPPRLSLRRQAQLGKQAYKQGRFEYLTSALQEQGKTNSVKLGKMRARIDELAAETGRQEQAVASATPRVIAAPHEESKRALALARALAATRGPYSGRSLRTIFKGTRAEREAPGKKLETAQKMATMAKTIETWRKVSSHEA